MLKALYFLEKCLIGIQWNDVDSLVSYVVNKSGADLSLSEIAYITEIAAFELSHDISVKQFVQGGYKYG